MSWSDVGDSWKYIAVIATSIFAAITLLTDVRHRRTRRITRWGYISVLGLIFSAAGGTIAVIAEQKSTAIKEERDKNYQQAVLNSISLTLRNVERILTPFRSPTMNVVFSLDCRSDQFKTFCDASVERLKAIGLSQIPAGNADFRSVDQLHYRHMRIDRSHLHAAIPVGSSLWQHWPSRGLPNFRWGMAVVKEPSRFLALARGEPEVPDLGLSFERVFDDVHAVAIVDAVDRSITFSLTPERTSFAPSGAIISVLDLAAASLMLYDFNHDITDFKFSFANVFNEQNRIVRLEGASFTSRRVKLATGLELAAKIYVMPAKISPL